MGRPAAESPAILPGVGGAVPYTRQRPQTAVRRAEADRPLSAAPRRARPQSATVQRPVSASSAATAVRRARQQRQAPQFLVDISDDEALLPRPLPLGIPYVAQYTTYEELIDKNILTQEEHEKVHLGMDEVRELYHAKCQDQALNPNRQREARFMQLVSQNCRGMHFAMRENGLGSKSAQCVAEILGENRHYSVLDLSGNRLRDLGAEQLAALLEVNESIVHLALKSNDIGSVGAEHLARALQSNRTLTSLDLSGLSGINRNHLGTQGARAMGGALEANRTLAVLSLGANGLGNEGLGYMAHGLERNETLTEIDLGSNNLGWEACTVLGPLLQTCNVQVLNLERNELRDKGATILAQALRRENEARMTRDGPTGPGSKIRSLNLAYNCIRAPGFKWLADMIGQTRRVQVLRLDGNDPGEMTPELAAAVKENGSLSHLALCKCEISDDGAVAIGDALDGQTTLTKVELTDNHMGDRGTIALANALRKNRTLRALDLGNNKLGDAAGHELAAMFTQNFHLQHLNLRQNNIREAGDAMADKLRHNTSLLGLDFAYNDFSYKSYSAIAQTLQRNNRLWRSQAGPRLMGKIDALKGDEAALYGTEEEILQEIKRREQATDALLQKKENNKRAIANLHRMLESLEVEVQESREAREQDEAAMAERGRELSEEKGKLENQKRKVERDLKEEENKMTKLKRDMKKVEDEIKDFLKTEEDDLKGLMTDLRRATDDNKNAEDEKAKGAERLGKVEYEIKQLSPAIPGGAASPGADGAGGKRMSTAAGSGAGAARRRSKTRK
eukprot:TRINITY_DN450_c0_g3_i1.p1 TRINITY_DN450_c0_g3~~TRINITY_DN450_c0_g3_i1.p1  ORF type:complete len:791 (+),score=322.18 TRINITY_DN450_c0_g3_i1:96-2468(+)